MDLFTEGQTRLNTGKILALIEEALTPENGKRVFVACLTRISPAEVLGYFTEVAFQLRHGHIMRLPSAHLDRPIPYPPNLFLAATMDSAGFDWQDEDLIAWTTIIPWQADVIKPGQKFSLTELSFSSGRAFLNSSLRDSHAARQKLNRITRDERLFVSPLLEIEGVLKRHGVEPAPAAFEEMVIYTANAWSQGGRGLFDFSPRANLRLALDFGIEQSILPRARAAVQQSPALRQALRRTLNKPFPRSAAYLERLA